MFNSGNTVASEDCCSCKEFYSGLKCEILTCPRNREGKDCKQCIAHYAPFPSCNVHMCTAYTFNSYCHAAGSVSFNRNDPVASGCCNCQPNYQGTKCQTRFCHADYDCRGNAITTTSENSQRISGIYPNCVCRCKKYFAGRNCRPMSISRELTKSVSVTASGSSTATQSLSMTQTHSAEVSLSTSHSSSLSPSRSLSLTASRGTPSKSPSHSSSSSWTLSATSSPSPSASRSLSSTVSPSGSASFAPSASASIIASPSTSLSLSFSYTVSLSVLTPSPHASASVSFSETPCLLLAPRCSILQLTGDTTGEAGSLLTPSRAFVERALLQTNASRRVIEGNGRPRRASVDGLVEYPAEDDASRVGVVHEDICSDTFANESGEFADLFLASSSSSPWEERVPRSNSNISIVGGVWWYAIRGNRTGLATRGAATGRLSAPAAATFVSDVPLDDASGAPLPWGPPLYLPPNAYVAASERHQEDISRRGMRYNLLRPTNDGARPAAVPMPNQTTVFGTVLILLDMQQLPGWNVTVEQIVVLGGLGAGSSGREEAWGDNAGLRVLSHRSQDVDTTRLPGFEHRQAVRTIAIDVLVRTIVVPNTVSIDGAARDDSPYHELGRSLWPSRALAVTVKIFCGSAGQPTFLTRSVLLESPLRFTPKPMSISPTNRVLGAALGGAGFASAVAVPVSAMQQGVVMAMLRMMQCNEDVLTGEPMDTLQHPLGLPLGSGKGQFARGAIVCNAFVIPLAWAIVMWLLAPLVMRAVSGPEAGEDSTDEEDDEEDAEDEDDRFGSDMPADAEDAGEQGEEEFWSYEEQCRRKRSRAWLRRCTKRVAALFASLSAHRDLSGWHGNLIVPFAFLAEGTAFACVALGVGARREVAESAGRAAKAARWAAEDAADGIIRGSLPPLSSADDLLGDTLLAAAGGLVLALVACAYAVALWRMRFRLPSGTHSNAKPQMRRRMECVRPSPQLSSPWRLLGFGAADPSSFVDSKSTEGEGEAAGDPLSLRTAAFWTESLQWLISPRFVWTISTAAEHCDAKKASPEEFLSLGTPRLDVTGSDASLSQPAHHHGDDLCTAAPSEPLPCNLSGDGLLPPHKSLNLSDVAPQEESGHSAIVTTLSTNGSSEGPPPACAANKMMVRREESAAEATYLNRRLFLVGDSWLLYASFAAFIFSVVVGVADGMPTDSSQMCRARWGVAAIGAVGKSVSVLASTIPIEAALLGASSVLSCVLVVMLAISAFWYGGEGIDSGAEALMSAANDTAAVNSVLGLLLMAVGLGCGLWELRTKAKAALELRRLNAIARAERQRIRQQRREQRERRRRRRQKRLLLLAEEGDVLLLRPSPPHVDNSQGDVLPPLLLKDSEPPASGSDAIAKGLFDHHFDAPSPAAQQALLRQEREAEAKRQHLVARKKRDAEAISIVLEHLDKADATETFILPQAAVLPPPPPPPPALSDLDLDIGRGGSSDANGAAPPETVDAHVDRREGSAHGEEEKEEGERRGVAHVLALAASLPMTERGALVAARRRRDAQIRNAHILSWGLRSEHDEGAAFTPAKEKRR